MQDLERQEARKVKEEIQDMEKQEAGKTPPRHLLAFTGASMQRWVVRWRTRDFSILQSHEYATLLPTLHTRASWGIQESAQPITIATLPEQGLKK